RVRTRSRDHGLHGARPSLRRAGPGGVGIGPVGPGVALWPRGRTDALVRQRQPRAAAPRGALAADAGTGRAASGRLRRRPPRSGSRVTLLVTQTAGYSVYRIDKQR